MNGYGGRAACGASSARGAPPRRLRPDQRLAGVVVGLEVLVRERPVHNVGAGDRPEERELLEVEVPEPRRLRVPERRPAADGARDRVHVADRNGLALALAMAKRAGLEVRVCLPEPAEHLQLEIG